MSLANNKILFVVCVNDESLYATCLKHLKNLHIPKSYIVDVLAIRDTNSIFSAYNEALRYNHKYKIYLHQDVFILKQDLIISIIRNFQQDSRLGMMGLVGTSKSNDIMARWDRGFINALSNRRKVLPWRFGSAAQPFSIVYSIDGLFMATQYDIPWRSDVFKGFHIYDRSQSVEFLRRGYKIGIPHSSTPTCTHYHTQHFQTFNQAEYRKIVRHMKQVYATEARRDPILGKRVGVYPHMKNKRNRSQLNFRVSQA